MYLFSFTGSKQLGNKSGNTVPVCNAPRLEGGALFWAEVDAGLHEAAVEDGLGGIQYTLKLLDILKL